MSVLVTGGAGYIGSHMVLALTDAGHDVVVLDNLSTGMAWAVSPKARLVEGDIADQALVDRLISDHAVDAVVHFAGSIVVPDSVTDPLGYYHNNTCKSRSLIESAVKGGVPHFIFSSTAAVYGNPKSVPVRESDELLPISPYGTSKLMSEMMLRDLGAASDMRHVILRYFNVAGSDPDGRIGQSTEKATLLIKVAVEVAVGKREQLYVFGTDYPTPDGTGVRDYIHVMDLVRGHLKALEYLQRGPGISVHNLGTGKGYSVLDVLAAFERASGREVPYRIAERRPGDAAECYADPTKANVELQWQARYDIRRMCEDVWRWQQKYPDGYH